MRGRNRTENKSHAEHKLHAKSTSFIRSRLVLLLLCSDVAAAATWCYSHTAVAILGETWKYTAFV